LDDEEKRRLVKQYVEDEQIVTEFRLIFRATRDGWTANDFHNLCDNQGPFIAIVKTTHGKILGAYAKAPLDVSGHYRGQPAFIFSYDLKKKFIPQSYVNSTYNTAGYCLYFGINADFTLGNGMNN
jgi:TLD